MNQCTEFAVFRVEKENVSKVIDLSKAIHSEMNEANRVIISSNVLLKTDNPEEICWHLEWVSVEAAKKQQRNGLHLQVQRSFRV
jgi:hypothetical protein